MTTSSPLCTTPDQDPAWDATVLACIDALEDLADHGNREVDGLPLWVVRHVAWAATEGLLAYPDDQKSAVTRALGSEYAMNCPELIEMVVEAKHPASTAG